MNERDEHTLALLEAANPVAADDLRRELSEQVARPVLWADCVQRAIAGGATVFVELGAGQVLTGLVQRLEGSFHAQAVGDAATAEAAVPWLAARGPFGPAAG
jgi:[acyl-carrier-protein] S-malonyltransferase